MGLLSRLLLAAWAPLLCTAAQALDWQLSVDARLAVTDATTSFLHDGLGKFRYDDGTTAQIGRARLALEQRFGDTLHLVVDASTWGDSDRHPVDLTEAYLEYRSYPHAAWRTRFRVGAFYPPSSLENRAGGWESPYAISSSALNTWIAEEIRAIGVEAAVDHLGSKQGGVLDWGLFGGVYGWNDPAGVLVASHGFALHDRQTPLHGRIGRSDSSPLPHRQLFYEIDGRPGYYIGAKAKYLDRFEARAMHYDNRADPTVFKPSINDFAWMTKFDTIGIRYETPRQLTLMAQWLAGDTAIAPDNFWLRWRYATWNVLANQRWGAQALTLRFDQFKVRELANLFEPAAMKDDGKAWTLAYAFERQGAPWRFMAEYTRVASSYGDRFYLLGIAPRAVESKLELSARYTLSNHAN